MILCFICFRFLFCVAVSSLARQRAGAHLCAFHSLACKEQKEQEKKEDARAFMPPLRNPKRTKKNEKDSSFSLPASSLASRRPPPRASGSLPRSWPCTPGRTSSTRTGSSAKSCRRWRFFLGEEEELGQPLRKKIDRRFFFFVLFPSILLWLTQSLPG